MKNSSFIPLNYVSNSATQFLVTLRVLVTSMIEEAFNPAKGLSI
jgi:hypothetical protein